MDNKTVSPKNDLSTHQEKINSPPIVTVVSNPVITLIDTCKRSSTILVPTEIGKQTTTTNKGEVVILSPPEVKEAGYLVAMKNFNMEQGLALSSVLCGYKDKIGNLWFGTDGGGVSKYDGKFFTSYSPFHGLAGNQIKSINEDEQGNLWFGTNANGISKYDGKQFTNFDTKDGLAGNVVFSIAKDKEGNLWFGTDSGVSKYNGKKFTNFTTKDGLPNICVKSIIEDRLGNLWFGTDGGGVCKYSGNWRDVQLEVKNKRRNLKDFFTTLTTAQGLANNNICSISEDKAGNLWFGTNGGGVSKYDGNRVHAIENGEKIAIEHREDIKMKNGKPIKTFTNYTTAQGLANNTVMSITVDTHGDIWFGTLGGGMSKYDGTVFTSYTTSNGLANNSVRSITEDKTGSLWFGTIGGGLSKYDGKFFTSFTSADGLANNQVFSIAEDKKGNLWFGTYGGGVSKYDGNRVDAIVNSNNITAQDTLGIEKCNGKFVKTFTNFTTAQGLGSNIVYSILVDKRENIWFGTEEGGVSKYDGKTIINYTTDQGLAHNTVICMMEDKMGNIWLGTLGGGVSKYDGNRVEAIAEEKDTSIKFQHGLKKHNKKFTKSFTNFTTNQGLAQNTVWSITEDKKGNIWFATEEGICKYDGNRIEEIEAGETIPTDNQDIKKENGKWVATFTHFDRDKGLVNRVVFCSMEDKKGNLWFGTGGGVSRYDGKTFTNYTTDDGLADDVVFGIVEDTLSNEMWCGTNMGLSGININPGLKGESEKVKFENYNTINGYPILDLNPKALFKDSKGIIWAGTGDKLVRFDNKGIIKNTEPLPVFIQSVKINNEDICWNDILPAANEILKSNELKKDIKNSSDTTVAIGVPSSTKAIEEISVFGRRLDKMQRDSIRMKYSDIKFDSISRYYPIPQNLVLPFERNKITFNYAAIETARPLIVRYQYILEGYDKNWSPVTELTTATFGNIPEGDYKFKLKTRSPDGIWSEPIIYQFKVLPPWYRTLFMCFVYIITAIFIVALIVWANGRRLRKRAQELTLQIRKAIKQIEEQREVVKEQQIRELELIAIRAQMNPHFLFNVLSSIQMLINKNDIVLANNALAKFGKLMRLILENSEKQTISIEDEIEMLELYIDLESLRFPFNYTLDVDPLLDKENMEIPTMIIQPYIENAIKHGISSKPTDRKVNISFQRQVNHLFCIVEDNGVGRKMTEATKSKYTHHKSMGTKLSQDRLGLISKQLSDKAEVVIKDLYNKQGVPSGTRVELSIPITCNEN